MAVVGQLLVELSANVARLRTDMERASGLVESHTKRMAKAASVATGAIAALGAGLSVGVLAGAFRGAIEQIAALDDAAEKTGASVESLSSLLNTLAPTGAGLEQITDVSTKLVKSMVDAGDATSRAGRAFKSIGVETRDASGNMRSVDDVLVDIASALAQYEDGANKTALAQALLGKSGAQYLPMLKDLATLQRQAATVTGESAAKAEAFANQLRAVARTAELVRQGVAMSLLPTLSDLLGKLESIARITSNPIDWYQFMFGSASNIDAAVAAAEKDIDRLTRIVESGSDNAGGANMRNQPAGTGLIGQALQQAFGNPNSARAALLEAQRNLALLKSVRDTQRQLGVTGVSAARGPWSDARHGAGRRKLGTEEETAASAARDARDAYEEFASFVDQKGIDDDLKLKADAAKLLADQLQRAADASLSLLAAYERAEADADAGIARDVDAIKDAVDPTRALYRELERVRELTSAGLLPPEAGNARMMQIYSQIDGILLKIPEQAAEAQASMQQMLAPIESVFESAIIGGEKLSDVLASLAQDFARLMLRQQITGPLAALLSGGDMKSVGGTIVGAIAGGLGFRASGGPVSAGGSYIVGERGPELLQMGSSSGYVVPNHRMTSGGGPTIVQNITVDSRSDQASIRQAMEVARRSAEASIMDSMQRGGAFA
jgi:hypothetical protein